MEEFIDDNVAFIMCSEHSPNLSNKIVGKAITEIVTEVELATLFAVVENKVWWIEDEEYDYDVGTLEYKQAKKKTDLWLSFADELRNLETISIVHKVTC